MFKHEEVSKYYDHDCGLFCNTSARHKRHCAIPVRDKCDTSAMQVQHEQQECDMNDTIATQGENFDFDNNKSENVLSHPYINYMANKRIK